MFSIHYFSVLHQKAKTSETNAITPRQPPPQQQYPQANDYGNYNNDYSPKSNSKSTERKCQKVDKGKTNIL